MALKQPTPVSFFRAIFLCFLAILSPTSFNAIEEQDNTALEKQPDVVERYRISAVRRGLGGAFTWGASAAVVGFFLGWLAVRIFGQSDTAVSAFAAAGAAILLWATLAAKGWEIATWGNATLTERVNRWVFRGLYWIGTAVLVVAASWGFWVQRSEGQGLTSERERILCNAELRKVASGNATEQDADGLASCVRRGYFTGIPVAPLSDCSFYGPCPNR
ncbi:MAG: hypothetical protein EOR86_17795 [Mesorhizobium sp.]|uniref:hypothetical protein n=1 Tax=Mesorhizobium sp. TaxID=1871066 RepID=UPI000FE67875|nr:hypothetical protein [Mesorhizobium sp.]RWM94040.1 MAG: hypothetical protein EOR86_17795 [Mesorhizobium sp.]